MFITILIYEIYINGSLDSNGADNPKTYSNGIHTGTGEFSVGSWYDNAQKWYGGLVDEVIVFNRALSALEIREIYIYGIDGSKGAND